MCRKVTCSTCSKPTFEGCGQHVETALDGVKIEERCLEWKLLPALRLKQCLAAPAAKEEKTEEEEK